MARRFTPPLVRRVKDPELDPMLRNLDQRVRELVNANTGGVLVDVAPYTDGTIELTHNLGRTPVGATVVGSDKGVFNVSVTATAGNVVTLGVSREWELLETKSITTATQDVDFDYTLTTSDHEVRIDGFWKTSADTTHMFWGINGAHSNTLSNCHSVFSNFRVGSAGTLTGLVTALQNTATTATEHHFVSSMLVRTGENRLHIYDDSVTDGTAAANTNRMSGGGKWEDTTTTISSVGVYTGVSGHITSGSEFSLYRKPLLNGRKLKIWLF